MHTPAHGFTVPEVFAAEGLTPDNPTAWATGAKAATLCRNRFGTEPPAILVDLASSLLDECERTYRKRRARADGNLPAWADPADDAGIRELVDERLGRILLADDATGELVRAIGAAVVMTDWWVGRRKDMVPDCVARYVAGEGARAAPAATAAPETPAAPEPVCDPVQVEAIGKPAPVVERVVYVDAPRPIPELPASLVDSLVDSIRATYRARFGVDPGWTEAQRAEVARWQRESLHIAAGEAEIPAFTPGVKAVIPPAKPKKAEPVQNLTPDMFAWD